MRRRLLALILTLAVLLAMCPGASAYILGQKQYDDVDYWDDTTDISWYNNFLDTFTLYTGAQLAGLASLIQQGRTTFAGKTILLGADIYLNEDLLTADGDLTSGKHNEWTPIGCYRNGWQPFSGVFDGKGHIISGVYINQTNEYNDDKNQGFFGYCHSATIKNITVVDSYIYGYDYVGGVIGNTYKSTIANCSFSGFVGGPLRVGGVAGATAMESKLLNCFASGYAAADRYVGGVTGYIDGTSGIESCYSICLVSVNDGALEKFGATPNGGIVGVADKGSTAASCGYLYGAAEKAAGQGSISAPAFNWADFSSGFVVTRMDSWANDQTGLWQRWESSNGIPQMECSGNGFRPVWTLPPAYLRPEAGYIYTKNFHAGIGSYSGFSDAVETEWYGTSGDGSLAMTVNLGIMNGYTDGTFLPNASLKISEAIKMAVNVYDIYNNGKITEFHMGPVWYEEIVAYAIEKGIIAQGDFADYTANATRAQMAYIFAKALPDSELSAINVVQALPDVTANTSYSDYIFKLYRAGILSGNDAKGRFDPDSPVTRVQAAAIIARLAVVSFRKTLSFTA